MPKKIYVGLQDPRKREAVARKTGLSLDLLKKAAEGKVELSAADFKKLDAALASDRG